MAPPIPPPDEGLNAAVAAVLRAEKAAQDRTNDWLAERTDLSKSSVQRFLATERHIDVAALEQLAIALGLTPVELVQAAQDRLGRAPSNESSDAPPTLALAADEQDTSIEGEQEEHHTT